MKKNLLIILFITFSAGINAQSIQVKRVFNKGFNESDAVQPILELDGNYLFTSYEVIADKNEIAFLSSINPEIIIYSLENGKKTATITIDLIPIDFKYSNDKFYLLYDKYIEVYGRNGETLEVVHLTKSFDFEHELRIIEGNILLLTSEEKTYKIYDNHIEEVSNNWIFSNNSELKVTIDKNGYFFIEGVNYGLLFSDTVNLDSKIASVTPIGIEDDKVFLYYEKFITESPLQIEPRILVYSIDSEKIVYNEKLPNVFYTNIKNSFKFTEDKLYHFISTSSGFQIFQLSFINNFIPYYYPDDLLNLKYHYNDHLPKITDSVFINQNNGNKDEGKEPCTITPTQVETNALAYRDLIWSCTINSLRSPCTDRCSNSCKATITCGTKVVTPTYISGTGSFIGVPYKWGGWTPLNNFNALADQGRFVGNWLTSATGGTCPDPLADQSVSDTYVIGVDCSGFITRAWGLTSQKYSTTSLPSICDDNPIIASQMELGDIWNDAGTHVRMFISGNPTGTMNLIESTTGGGAKVRTYTYNYSQLSSYLPLRYNGICTNGNPTLDCSNFVQLNCGVTYNGPASSASSNVSTYGCNTWTETGPERVHKITASVSGTITATISNFTGDLDVYILGSCDPNDCLGIVSSSSATYANASAGTSYYIIVDADDGSGSSYSLLITCTPNTPNLPDLSVSNAGMNPISVCPGVSVSVNSYVNNAGTALAGASTMKYYISSNTTYDGSDILLGNSSVPAINAGGSSSQINASFTIPEGTLPGSYYILYYADAPPGVISESNENNNVAYKAINVSNCSSSPDLVISNPYFSSYSLCTGSTVNVSCDIENIGGSTAPASTVKYYLSADNAYQVGDVLLGSTSIGSLNSNSYTSVSKTLTVPMGTAIGSWYILIIADADDNVNEGTSGELNNVFSDAIQVTNCEGLADLTIHANSYTPAIITPGTTLHINYTAENLGSVSASPIKIGVYTSLDDIFDPLNDEFIGEWFKGSLAPDQPIIENLNVSIPNCFQCGNFYVFLVIDYPNLVNESNENNNNDSFQVSITGCINCSYSVPPTGINFQSAGGSGNFTVTSTNCCEWNATTSDSWITVLNDFGYGTSVINYTVAPCSGGNSRTGTISVAGQTHTITQNCIQSCNNSQTFIWGVQAGSTTLSDEANDVAIDASGNLYMTGDIQGAAAFGGGITLTTPSNAPDIFVSKHNSSGIIQWAVRYGDTDQEYGTGISTDSNGDIYIIGNSANSITFESTTLTANGTNEGITFLIKLNSSGVLQWAKKINALYDGYVNDIVIDNENNIFVTGSLNDYNAGNGNGLFIAKYNTSGTQIWYKTYGFTFFLKDAFGIAVDNIGNLVISGRFMNTITLGSTTLTTSDYLDMPGFISKLDANGNVLWAKQVISPGQSQDALRSVAVDIGNNIYTVGNVDSTAIVGDITIPRSKGNKLILIKYDQSGNPIWAKVSETGFQGNQQRIIKGNDGKMYVAGCFAQTLKLDTKIITCVGSNDGFIGGIDTDGTVLWLKGFGNVEAESANGIVCNSTNDLFVAGGFRGTVVFGSTTLTSIGSTDIYLAKFKQCDPPTANITYSGSLIVCDGDIKSLETEYCSLNTYQWLRNNIEIPGATSPSYSATQSGSYTVLVSPFAGCSTMSNPVNITIDVISIPIITKYGNLLLSTGAASYQWNLNNNLINGATNQFYEPLVSGDYSVSVTDLNGCSAMSNTIYMVVIEPVPSSISIQNAIVNGGQSSCYNALQTITVAGNGTTFTVKNGGSTTMIAGQNILYQTGTIVESGGYMWGYIAPSGPYCVSPSMPAVLKEEEEQVPMISEKTSFKIYPNPTIGSFILELSETLQGDDVKVEIFGMRGEKILLKHLNAEKKHEFSLAGKSTGIYFIRVISGTVSETGKIIKQ